MFGPDQTRNDSWSLWARYRDALLIRRRLPHISAPVVPPGEVVLSFVDLPSGLATWLRTDQKLSFRKAGPASKGYPRSCRQAERAPALWNTPGKQCCDADARELSRWLLGPWDQGLDRREDRGDRDRRCGFSTSVAGAWCAPNGHYWTEDFAIQVRAGTGGQAKSDPRLAHLQEALAVGAPAIGSELSLPPLPEARREAEKVFSLISSIYTFRGTNCDVGHKC